MRTTEITNNDDLIDTREVIGILDGLEGDHCEGEPWTDEDRAYRDSLQALLDEVNEVAEYERAPRDGMTLVRETYWRDYVRQWHEDTYGGDLHQWNPNTFKYEALSWDDLMSRMPFSCIDWKWVAEKDRRDAPEVEWDGVTYIVG